MNEKSKAFELIEFVWNNEKTDSYLRVNIAMYEAVKLAIISQMKFNKEDFQNIFSKFSGGYWFGVNANGKGYGENFYREAVTSGNISACQSYEAFCNIKPFIDSKGRRLCKGAMYRDIGKTDKEGTEIYEHDIISVNGKYPKLVKYIDEYACFCLANISDLNKEWMNPWQQISPDWWNDFKRKIRVIGNAFDNPELMKEGANHEYAI